VTLLVPWLVFPFVLAALCLGCGLLVERITRSQIPSELLLPVGLATVVALGALTVSLAATARLTTPLLTALAAAGLVLGRHRRPTGWAVGAAAATYVCYGAPILASGAATFAGYIKLDDTATFLALTDRLFDHGRSIAGLPPSTYEATLSGYLTQGYPVGSLVPLGIAHELLRTDLAWLYQPWLSFCAGTLALCLYRLAEPLIPSRPLRALAAFVAAQSALLFGYALWGGVKELVATTLIATAAATAPAPHELGRARVLPFSIACAAVLDTLSVVGILWLLPFALLLIPLARRAPAAVAAAAAAVAVLAVPALATAGRFLSGTNVTTLQSGGELGNLVRPLRPLQIVGIWPNGDFRLDPRASTATALLIALAVAAALTGAVLAANAGAWPLLLGAASAVLGALVFVTVGSPWVGAKALAIGSPFVLLTALCGCLGLASPRAPFSPGVRRVVLVAGITAALALIAGVAWSDALAYHDVDLAPRGQLRELEHIGNRFAGQGPALMTEYQPYGARHFLRRLDAEGASELRRRPIPLRGGRVAAKGEYVDLDRIDLSALLVYRTLVLRRSPTESRPPAPYTLVWRGRWYDVWQRQAGALPRDHLPLGTGLQAAAVPGCGTLQRLARRGSVVAAARPLNVVWPLGSTGLPAGWSPLPGGAIVAARTGTVVVPIVLQHGGRYRLWLGGSVRGTLRAKVDGRPAGSVSSQLQNEGQWLALGSAPLTPGSHIVSLAVTLPRLMPGTGGDDFPLGPLLLEPETTETVIAPTRPSILCGRPLDWAEVVPFS
jgi:hypothetical protein